MESNPVNKGLYLQLLFIISICVIVVTKSIIYFQYSLQLIDTDQAYMWQAATDFANGHFYEPRYYGQNYNTMLEAFLAAPLLFLKIPVYASLPLVTIILSLFPFLFSAFFLFLKNQKVSALIVLSILICLPAQFDLLTSLPRGFVTGLFFTSFFICSIISPQNMRLLFLNTAMALLAYFVNQNSVLVSIPFLFYLFLINYQKRIYFIVTCSALLLAIPLDFFFNQFYRLHPDYVLQSTFNTFSLKYFIQAISHLDERFQHIGFFIPNQCYTLMLALGLLSWLLFKQNKKAFKAFVVFIAIILFSFFASKVSDGSNWVYMSYSRMYLGIPIYIALFLPLIRFNLNKIALVLLCLPLLFSIYKLGFIKSELKKEDQRTISRGVRLLSLESCMDITKFYKNKSEENNCHFLLVSSTFWLNTIVSNAGPALYKDYPDNQETRFEKRYWLRNKNKNRLISKFIFLSSDYNLNLLLPTKQKFELIKLDDYGLYLVKNNQLKMGEFIDYINTIEPGLND